MRAQMQGISRESARYSGTLQPLHPRQRCGGRQASVRLLLALPCPCEPGLRRAEQSTCAHSPLCALSLPPSTKSNPLPERTADCSTAVTAVEGRGSRADRQKGRDPSHLPWPVLQDTRSAKMR